MGDVHLKSDVPLVVTINIHFYSYNMERLWLGWMGHAPREARPDRASPGALGWGRGRGRLRQTWRWDVDADGTERMTRGRLERESEGGDRDRDAWRFARWRPTCQEGSQAKGSNRSCAAASGGGHAAFSLTCQRALTLSVNVRNNYNGSFCRAQRSEINK